MSALQESLLKHFPSSQILLKNSPAYNERNETYLSRLESDIQPACILTPATKEDVATFLKIARQENVSFAIRGAGQQPAPGCANIEGGITLDLHLLTGLHFREGVVEIGAGERWAAVYEAAQARGLGVTGSRSGRGGIGGLALSGGLSFFSSREGFICDNVVNFEVGLASGEIVNANASENPDLWKALRGGGNNLGVVTKFTLRTFPQGKFWGGSVYYFPNQFSSQIKALVDELHRVDASEETHLMMSIGYAAQFGQTMCMNQMYYTREVEKPAVLEPFTSVQPQIEAMNSMRMLTLVEAAGEQAADSKAAVRQSYMNITVKADVATLHAATEIYTRELEKIKSCEGLISSLTVQPYPVSLLQKSSSNSLGLSSSSGPLVSILFLTCWTNASDDQLLTSTISNTLTLIKQDAAGRGTLSPFVYMNYAWTDQDPIGSYGKENQEALQRASKKYDPEGIFQKRVPGGWKLFD